MYFVKLKTMLTDAMRQTFDADYVNPQFRNLHASIDYPVDVQNYPGVWVDFAPVGELTVVGIGHREVSEVGSGGRQFTRWRFKGTATYTVVALSSLERDSLTDELIRVFAFGREAEQTSEFRAYIEDNEFLACNFDFDAIDQHGFAVSPGTPWGTDEMIYEGTLSMEVFGEFISDSVSGTIAPLESIQVVGYTQEEGDPSPSW